MIRRALASAILRLCGWRLVGQVADRRQILFIFAPHTSNWDFPLMVLAKVALGLQVNFLGKDSLFRFPHGWFFRWMGGIPVVRHERQNVVQNSIAAFASHPDLKLALAPEGTRKKTDYWRTGFWHIAVGAKVPVQLAFLDAPSRTLGLGPVIELSGDLDADFAVLRRFYAERRGIRPELASTVRPR